MIKEEMSKKLYRLYWLIEMQSYNLTMSFLSLEQNITLCRKNGHKTHTESKIYKMSSEYIGKLEG